MQVYLDIHQPSPSMGMHTHTQTPKVQISGVWESYLGNISPLLSPSCILSLVSTTGHLWK